MKNIKKLFVISDLHGHYKITIDALRDAGYDENDKNNLLLVLGDIFDRGLENKEIYIWLKRLTDEGKAIVLRGNHDQFLIDFLENPCKVDNLFNFNNNGLKTTIYSLLNNKGTLEDYYNSKPFVNSSKAKVFKAWNMCVSDLINKMYPDLLDWIKSFNYYYETESYIFTHASIDGFCGDFRRPDIDWETLLCDDGSFFGRKIKNTKKTVVVGHFNTRDIRFMYGVGKKNYFSVLKRKDGKVIMVDACTIVSKKVNVLVIKENIM